MGTTLSPWAVPYSGALFMPFLPSLRWMGLQTLSSSNVRCLYRLAADCECILVWLLRISPLYQRNILCIRNADSHTCILDSRVCQRSSSCFYFLSIPWNLLHSCAAVSLPACRCDLGSTLLRWLSRLFSRITPAEFFLHLLLSLCR